MELSLVFAILLAMPAHDRAVLVPAHEVEIVGLDYAFQVPTRIGPGLTTFNFVNKGTVPHELNIVLLKRGVTTQVYIKAANADQPLAPMIDATIGVLFAKKNKRSPSSLTTVLLPDREYAVRCIFRDTPTSPRHQQLGMFASLHITADRALHGPALVADTIFAMDYAYRSPQTLSPGRHYLVFTNLGKQRHEVEVTLLKKDVTIMQVRDNHATGGNIEELLDGDYGVLHSMGGTSPLGALQLDLLPGRVYLIECGYKNDDKSPEHYKLGMFATFKVSGTAR